MENCSKKKGSPMMEFIYLLSLTGVSGMNDLGAGIASDVCEKGYKLFFKTFFYLFIILTIVLAALKHMIGGY